MKRRDFLQSLTALSFGAGTAFLGFPGSTALESRTRKPIPKPQPHIFKPKVPLETRLHDMAASTPVKDVLVPALFRLIRRRVWGVSPANELERKAFRTMNMLRRNDPPTWRLIVKGLDKFDSIPMDLKTSLFDAKYLDDPFAPPTKPVSVEELGEDLAQELVATTNFTLSGTTARVAGSVRAQTCPPPTVGEPFDCLPADPIKIFTVNGLAPGGPAAQVVQGTDNAVHLTGVRFFHLPTSSDPRRIRVRIVKEDLSILPFFMDAEIWGDRVTPENDDLGVVIEDERVQDHLYFEFPATHPETGALLPGGLYHVTVVVPNSPRLPVGGFSVPDLIESGPVVLEAHAPPGASYEIWIDRMKAQDETDPESVLGCDECASDEVLIAAFSLLFNSSVNPPVRFGVLSTERTPIIEDVDDGDERSTPRDVTGFPIHLLGGEGFAVKMDDPDKLLVTFILGYEVDSDDAAVQAVEEEVPDALMAITNLFDFAGALLGDVVNPTADVALAIFKSVFPIGLSQVGGLILGPYFYIVGAAVLVYIWITTYWSPPDPIIVDVVIFSRDERVGDPALSLFDLTTGTGFQPDMEIRHPPIPGDLDMKRFRDANCKGRIGFNLTDCAGTTRPKYSEIRRYQSSVEESTYLLRLNIDRVD